MAYLGSVRIYSHRYSCTRQYTDILIGITLRERIYKICSYSSIFTTPYNHKNAHSHLHTPSHSSTLTEDASTVFFKHHAFIAGAYGESINRSIVSAGMFQMTSIQEEGYGDEDKKDRIGLRMDVSVPGGREGME